jgi:hypothetical protein
MESMSEQALAVVATILIVPIVFAVVLDLRGKGERVPRQWPRIVSWVLGVSLVAFGVHFYWWASREPSMEWSSAWTYSMPLAAIGVLAVIRPRWAAWELAITTLVVGLVVTSAGFGVAVMLYAPPALLAAALLLAAIPAEPEAPHVSGGGGGPISGPLPRA